MSLKYRVRFGTSIEKDLMDKFNRLAIKTRINKSRLIDEAIFDILVKYKIIEEVPEKELSAN